MLRWHNRSIDLLICALIGFGLLSAVGALFDGSRWRLPLIALGLGMALVGLSIGVHTHGWVTALDGRTASWLDYHARRSPRLFTAANAVAHLGNPAAVALAGLISAGLLSARYRSLVPGVVVVLTVGAAVFAKDVMKVVVERPVSQAEIALAAPGLGGAPHPFPSGHVAGTAALLGIVAFGIGARSGLAVRAFLASCALAGASVVALSRLVLDAHWLTDVIGGALLAGVVVALGAAVLSGTAAAGLRTQRGLIPRQQSVAQSRRLRT